MSERRAAIAHLIESALIRVPDRYAQVPDAVPLPLARAVRHFTSLLTRAARAASDEALMAQIADGAAAWFEALWHEMEQGGGVDSRSRGVTRHERALRLVAAPLADHLNAVLPQLRADSDRARALLGEPIQWELFNQEREPIDWSVLERAERIAAADTGLRRRCFSIVNAVPEPPPEPRVRHEEFEREERRTVDAGYGEVEGLGHGGRITELSGAELALYASGDADELFLARVAERELTTLSHRRERDTVVRRRAVRERIRREPLPAGDLFVCIDTSGSMRGLPEEAARATGLAITRYARRAGRMATLLAFHEGVVSVVVPPPGERAAFPEPLAARLSAFLGLPFAGGADLTPPLDAAIPAIEGGPERRNDLVIVSDLGVPKLTPDQTARLRTLQRRGWVTLHAITVARMPLSDPYNLFDTRLHFDTTPAEEAPSGVVGTSLAPRRLPGRRRRGRR